ncbi:hypothetical protein D8I35_05420 [Corticibacter populi]|uniref:Ribbon-helix-helix protein, CopG family n=1 Tax=Corticibacter populi TaxID=1550736 RepID=A0A3M6QZQ9_9BURK|nr:hypothetical protein [Corticibacter populi]RMX08516.1 hypothetical protein D8I35_05420 [Corticibacter populi]
MTDFLFSRPMSSPLGKNSHTLKTSVPDLLKDRVEDLARELGTGESEVIRDILLLYFEGVTMSEVKANHQAAVLKKKASPLARNWFSSGQKKAEEPEGVGV